MFKKGEIGGSCKMYPDRLREGGDHKSVLQSWSVVHCGSWCIVGRSALWGIVHCGS